jgi:hypothetical protein
MEPAGKLYTGIVPKGTPVCIESERIDLTDDFGNRTGQMTAWSTNADILLDDPEITGKKAYHNQNVGYFVTSQPLGAGVYALVELKPPVGYARSKPVAIEIYSDKTQYYADGDMYAKVTAVREEGNLFKPRILNASSLSFFALNGREARDFSCGRFTWQTRCIARLLRRLR